MSELGDRLIADGSEYRLRSDGRTVSELVGRLELGERPSAMVAAGAVTPADVVAALAHEALGSDGAVGLPLVQARPARPRLERVLSEPAWAEVFPQADRPSRLAMAAGLLQVFDFWDASHEAAQQADDLGEPAFSAYWHGIAHRREPDPGNAAYWFRRVGRHALFTALADSARPILDEHGDTALNSRLLSGGWNAMAMIDLCSQAQPGSSREAVARRLQRLEMWLLLEATFAKVSSSMAWSDRGK
jgi:hypothetical protein